MVQNVEHIYYQYYLSLSDRRRPAKCSTVQYSSNMDNAEIEVWTYIENTRYCN